MNVFEQHQKLTEKLSGLKQPMGFVPTMGALHKGHLSLIEKAIEENAHVVVSIFVNPTQFDDPKDLKNYPRPLENDLKLLQPYGSSISVYTPFLADIYGTSFKTEKYDFQGLDTVMEGIHRKNHFNGVATVVEKFLRLLKPQKAYFGEKDFQQLQIIKSLVQQKELLTTIVSVPIVREADGLAMSSRNKLLNASQRKAATIIYETLQRVNALFGKASIDTISSKVSEIFNANRYFELDYFCIAHADTLLKVVVTSKEKSYRAFIAAKADGVRLIDNIKL